MDAGVGDWGENITNELLSNGSLSSLEELRACADGDVAYWVRSTERRRGLFLMALLGRGLGRVSVRRR
jgi:hypothetical protein